MSFCAYYLIVGSIIRVRYSSSAGASDLPAIIANILPSMFLVLTVAGAAYYAAIRGSVEVLLRWMFLAAFLASLSVFLDLFYPGWTSLVEFRKDFQGRATGFFANPNELGLEQASPSSLERRSPQSRGGSLGSLQPFAWPSPQPFSAIPKPQFCCAWFWGQCLDSCYKKEFGSGGGNCSDWRSLCFWQWVF